MLTIHFSVERRDVIDYQIGAQFVAIGRSLEKAIRSHTRPDINRVVAELDQVAGLGVQVQPRPAQRNSQSPQVFAVFSLSFGGPTTGETETPASARGH